MLNHKVFGRMPLGLLIAVFSVLLSVSSVFATHTCDENWWWADENVIWCVHAEDGWSYWTDADSVRDLDEILQDTYGVDSSELYTMGDLPMVAGAFHPGADDYAVYAQLFVTEFDPSEYESDEDFLLGISIDDFEIEIIEASDGSVIGRAEDTTQRDTTRAWTIYPFEELELVYIVAGAAANSVWNSNSDLRDQLDDLMLSLQVYFEEGSNQSESSRGSNSSSQSDYPVWVGGEILQIFSESGNGDPENGFVDGVWEFFSDSTVVFTPDGLGSKMREDLFPLEGSFTADDANIVFSDGIYDIEGGTL